MIGSTISHYKIIEKLGEGGMGVVYKAQDTKLERFVALKFLPAHMSGSEQDKARFLQEAQAAASLNHHNICTIYGIEEHEGQIFIAMELVEGQTLREMKQLFSVKQAVDIGTQIADGLAAAHEKGIVHRDIKPENIMIRKDGIVQIMDFGLAKLRGASRLTKEGSMVGTVGYMSPEQVQGFEVDYRTDIFSVGVVLYELLAGGSPFKGVHETAVMYEIVNVEPQPISTMKEGIDPRLDEIILECLEKDKDDRYQSAKELAKDLRKIKQSSGNRKSRMYDASKPGFETTAGHMASARKSGSFTIEVLNRRIDLATFFRSGIVPWSLSILLFIALVATWLILHKPSQANIVTRFSLDIGGDNVLDMSTYPALAISHDGTKLVFKASNKLFLRRMDSMLPVLISGTDNASSPFFSADDKWIGCFSSNKLQKISLNGGTPVTLADASDNRGATWNKDGLIVFAVPAGEGLSLVSENGGLSRHFTTIDSTNNERTHRWPSFLPDGKHVLFTVGKLSSPDYYENAIIDVADIETGERKNILKDASTARYINSGHLLFSRSGVLYVVPFDADKLEVKGQPIPVVEGVSSDLTTGSANYVVSDNGTLAYIPGSIEGENRKIVKIDMQGKIATLDSTGHRYLEPQLSPDNSKIALVVGNGEDYDIWIFVIKNKTLSRLTFGGLNRSPQWSSDGKNIAFMKRTKDGEMGVFVKPFDGSGDEIQIYKAKNRIYVDEWTGDGENLIIDELDATSSKSSLVVIPLKGEKKSWNYSNSKFDEYEACISPNRKWIAYLTNESGLYQIYVRSFPNKEGKWQISTDVAEEPRWSPDGKTLYYRKGSQMISVPVSTSTTFSAGIPKVLFSGFPAMNVDSGISYDITSDGRYFITTSPVGGTTFKNISLVLNWTNELRTLISTEK